MQESSEYSPIVRIEDAEKLGLKTRYIFGLNIFVVNEVDVPYTSDPSLLFLKRITESLPSSAQLGWLALKDLIDKEEEAFGTSTTDNEYTQVRISLHGGQFYVPEDRGSIVFPHVKEPFWQPTGLETEPVQYCFGYDALAIYAGAERDAANVLVELANTPFLGQGQLLEEFQEQWLHEATGLYDLVILSQCDGWYFEAYTKNPDSFSALDKPLSDAVASIKASAWYQEHEAELKWDDELDGCLKIMP